MLVKLDIDPANTDNDGLAVAQQPLGAVNLTLNGALISGGTFTDAAGGRQLLFTTVADESGKTLTVTGTDADGYPQSEVVTGPNATSGESTKYFKTVASVAASGAFTSTVAVGTVDEIASRTVRLNNYAERAALCHLDVTGTINATVQVTLQNLSLDYTGQDDVPWIATQDTDLVTATADAIGSLDEGATGCRIVVNSYASGAELQAYISDSIARG